MNPNPPALDPTDTADGDRDDPATPVAIATGDRRDEVHFEPDPDQLVVVRHLVRPQHALAPEQPVPSRSVAEADAPPVEDVRVAPEGPSVWDARPPPDDADAPAEPTGH